MQQTGEGNFKVNVEGWLCSDSYVLSVEGNQCDLGNRWVLTTLTKCWMPLYILSFNLKTECLGKRGLYSCLDFLVLTMCWWSCCSTLIALGQLRKLIYSSEAFCLDQLLKTGGRQLWYKEIEINSLSWPCSCWTFITRLTNTVLPDALIVMTHIFSTTHLYPAP